MSRLLILLCALLAASPQRNMNAEQSDDALEERIIRAMQADSGSLQLSRHDPSLRQFQPMVWRRGSSQVTFSYMIYPSVDDAKEATKWTIAAMQIPTRPIQDFADEAYLVAPGDTRGLRELVFRRGRYVYAVEAPGLDAVSHYSRLFLTQIDVLGVGRPNN